LATALQGFICHAGLESVTWLAYLVRQLDQITIKQSGQRIETVNRRYLGDQDQGILYIFYVVSLIKIIQGIYRVFVHTDYLEPQSFSIFALCMTLIVVLML
jgi:hypothetical protein